MDPTKQQTKSRNDLIEYMMLHLKNVENTQEP